MSLTSRGVPEHVILFMPVGFSSMLVWYSKIVILLDGMIRIWIWKPTGSDFKT